MVLAIVLKLVPTIATTVLASLVKTAVLALLTDRTSAVGPWSRRRPAAPVRPGHGGRARIATRCRRPDGSRRARGAQEDLVPLRRRGPRRVDWSRPAPSLEKCPSAVRES